MLVLLVLGFEFAVVGFDLVLLDVCVCDGICGLGWCKFEFLFWWFVVVVDTCFGCWVYLVGLVLWAAGWVCLWVLFYCLLRLFGCL